MYLISELPEKLYSLCRDAALTGKPALMAAALKKDRSLVGPWGLVYEKQERISDYYYKFLISGSFLEYPLLMGVREVMFILNMGPEYSYKQIVDSNFQEKVKNHLLDYCDCMAVDFNIIINRCLVTAGEKWTMVFIQDYFTGGYRDIL